MFPGLATVVSFYGLLADTGKIGLQLALFDGMVPDGVLALLGDELARVASRPGFTHEITLVEELIVERAH